MNSPSFLSTRRLTSYGRLLLLALVCVAALAPPPDALGAARAAAATEADLVVSKSGDETVALGGQITYNLSVFNSGPDDATNVVLTDALPAHTSFVSASSPTGTVTFANNTLTVNFGTLVAFDSGSATFVVSVNDDTPRGTTISNTVTGTSDTPDPDPSNNSATALTVVTGPFAGDVLISEFRLRGPGSVASAAPARVTGVMDADGGNKLRLTRTGAAKGARGAALLSSSPTPGAPDTSPQANDEFVELYNNTDTPIMVGTTDGSAGWALAASDGVVRFVVPAGTVIPARGHFLGVNTLGYSLASYPSGNDGTNPTTATGDPILLSDGTPANGYTLDIPDNVGIALFRTATTANFSTTTRLDAVGSTSEANALYKEGAGYTALAPSDIAQNLEHSFFRDQCGKGGSPTAFGPCPTHGLLSDTNNNASDFIFADTSGTNTAAGQRLGAPGPENLSSPTQQNASMPGFLLDQTVSSASSPNRVRDFTQDAQNNSDSGTLDIRRRIVNNTGAPVTRLRFRVVDITTLPAPSGIADLRARTSTDLPVSGVGDADTCPGGVTPCTVTVMGTTLEQPPSQPNGGGLNSSLSADTVTILTPLAPGDSVNVRFLLGIKQTGFFRFFVNIEILNDQSSGGELAPNKQTLWKPLDNETAPKPLVNETVPNLPATRPARGTLPTPEGDRPQRVKQTPKAPRL